MRKYYSSATSEHPLLTDFHEAVLQVLCCFRLKEEALCRRLVAPQHRPGYIRHR